MRVSPEDPIYPITRWKSYRRNPTHPEDPPIEFTEAKPGMTIRLNLAGQIAAAMMTPKFQKDVTLPSTDKVALAAFHLADELVKLENQSRAGKSAESQEPYPEIPIMIDRGAP